MYFFDNSGFLGWNCDIGIGRRKRCLFFWMGMLGYAGGIWDIFRFILQLGGCCDTAGSTWTIHWPFLEKYSIHLSEGSEIIYEGI